MKPTVKLDYTKLPGYEIMDKPPECFPIKSYNEDFYNTLTNFRMINFPIESDNKLFYNFHQNENASVSTTTGQLMVY